MPWSRGLFFTFLAHLGVFYAIPPFSPSFPQLKPPAKTRLWNFSSSRSGGRGARRALRPRRSRPGAAPTGRNDQYFPTAINRRHRSKWLPLAPDNSPLVRGDEPDLHAQLFKATRSRTASPTPSFGGGQETGDKAPWFSAPPPRSRPARKRFR